MTKKERLSLQSALNPQEKLFVMGISEKEEDVQEQPIPKETVPVVKRQLQQKKTPVSSESPADIVSELKASSKAPTQRITIEIEQDLYKAISRIAAETGHSKKDVISFALRKVIPISETDNG